MFACVHFTHLYGIWIWPRSTLSYHRVWVDGAMSRWWDDDAMVRWRTMVRQCDGDGAMTRWRWCGGSMAMKRCSITPSLLRLRTIALSIFCIVLFIIHFNDFKINAIECIIWKDNGNLQTYNTLCALILIIKDSSFYCEISMLCDFIERSPAAMSKIYTSGNVNKFEGCFSELCRKAPRSYDWSYHCVIVIAPSTSHHSVIILSTQTRCCNGAMVICVALSGFYIFARPLSLLYMYI